MMQEIRKVRKDTEAYMKDVPEAVDHDSASAKSIEFVIKISEYRKTPIKYGYLI